MAKFSTGLRDAILADAPLREVMDLGFIDYYSGAVPASADASIGSAVLLCTFSNNGTATGLTFDATASGGVIGKNPSEVWAGDNVADGVVSFFRHRLASDDGTLSTIQPRIQGTLGTGGADMNVSSVTLVDGAPNAINNYTISQPTN